MSWLIRLLHRMRVLDKRHALEAELEEELAHHLEMKRRALAAEGHPDPERGARRALGNATMWREETRAQWVFPRLEALLLDVRYAFRRLRKDRLFSLVALVTLTLGIGATTAIFSLLNGLLWRPLPVAAPDQLVRLRLTNLPPTHRQWTNGREIRATEQRSISFAMYEALQRHQQVFAGLFGSGGGGTFQFEVNGQVHRLPVQTVTGSFFPTLGVAPQVGQLLVEDDDRAGRPEGWRAVISDSLYTRLFQRNPNIAGMRVTIDRVPFSIAGVAPAGFLGINPGTAHDVWIPLSAMEAIAPTFRWRDNRGFYILRPMARLRPGVSIEAAQRHLDGIGKRVLEESKEDLRAEDEKHFLAMRFHTVPASSGFSNVASDFGGALWILFAAVGLVLLIAATNLMNLFLARSAARAQDFAVRVSLGAPAWRIRRELLLESGLLALGGTAGGVLLSFWLSSVMRAGVSGRFQRVVVDTAPDLRLLAFLAVVLISVVLVAGLLPALTAAKVSPQQALRAGSSGSRALPLRRLLVVVQTALSLTLLCGAGSMASSLRRLLGESTGFQAENAFFALPDLYNAGVPREATLSSYESILRALRAQPGIQAAAWTRSVPLTGGFSMRTAQVPGRTDLDEKQRSVFIHNISDGYFEAAGIPIRAGVDFPPQAVGRKDVAILSENAARRFFGSAEAAVGRRLTVGSGEPVQILGVVADSKYQSLREAAPLTLYLPYAVGVNPGYALVLRYRGARADVMSALQTILRREAGRMPSIEYRTVDGNIADMLSTERLVTSLLSTFAAFALLISATGLAGLLAYLVEQRKKELGIRLALGASPSQIRADVRRQALTLTLLGFAVGGALTFVLRKPLNAYLFGVAPTDPWIWAGGAVTLLIAAAAASAIPASRAAGIDPVAMLRDQG